MICARRDLICRSFCLALLISSFDIQSAAAQTPEPPGDACALKLPGEVAGARYERARTLSLQGRLPSQPELMRRASDAMRSCREAKHDSLGDFLLRSVQFRPRSSFSSDYPLDRNNGSLWSGRGVSLALSGGVELTRGPVTFGLLPSVAFQQNRDFIHRPTYIPGYSTFMNVGHTRRIDWPQRFGNDAFGTIDPGQSYVRLDIGALAGGVSHENLWIGPARRTPLLMSNSAPGFLHAFIGAHQVKTPIGQFWGELIWGRLQESDYFDQDPANDWRMLTGLTVTVEPRGARNLFVGFARLFASSTDGRGVGELLLRPYGLTGEDGTRAIDDNAMFALFVRYLSTAARAEVYVEWAHEAGFSGLADLLREPDHTQAYVLGFQKLVDLGARDLRAYGEFIHLEASPSLRAGRGIVSYYTHGNVSQGHTHRGQLLGAWIGPGSDAQLIGFDLVAGENLLGAYFERVRFDADGYYDQFAKYYGPFGHDLQLSVGLRNALRLGAIQLAFEASFAWRSNRNFLNLYGQTAEEAFEKDRNGLLEAEASWFWPGRK